MIINENPRKTNYINEKQYFIINRPMSSLFLSTAPQGLPFLFVYMLSMSCGMEYPFDQMEPAVSPPNSFFTGQPLTAQAGLETEKCALVSALLPNI